MKTKNAINTELMESNSKRQKRILTVFTKIAKPFHNILRKIT